MGRCASVDFRGVVSDLFLDGSGKDQTASDLGMLEFRAGNVEVSVTR